MVWVPVVLMLLKYAETLGLSASEIGACIYRYIYIYIERERERERDRERQRETERETARDRERETARDRERQRETGGVRTLKYAETLGLSASEIGA